MQYIKIIIKMISKVILLSLLISFSFQYNIDIQYIDDESNVQQSESVIADVFKCIKEIQPVAEDVEAIIAAIKSKNINAIIDLVYQAIEDGHDSLVKCLALFPEVEAYIKKYIKVNLDDLLKCITDSKDVTKEAIDLVNTIKKKDFYNLVPKIAQLLIHGDKLVKDCIRTFKEREMRRKSKHSSLGCFQYCSKVVSPIATTVDGYKLVEEAALRSCIAKCKAFLQ